MNTDDDDDDDDISIDDHAWYEAAREVEQEILAADRFGSKQTEFTQCDYTTNFSFLWIF